MNRSDTVAGMVAFVERKDAKKPPPVARCSRWPDCWCGRGNVVCAVLSQHYPEHHTFRGRP